VDVTVIGASGNIGTALLEALAADPGVVRVRAVARRPPSRSWPKTSFLALDVASADLVAAVDGADAVIHLAWLFQPTHRPTVTWRTNVGGSERVLDAVARHGVRSLLCASSVGAYSPGHGREVDESWPTDSVPTAGYGREKAYVERLLDALEARHPEMRVVRIRPGFVFQRTSGSQQRRLFAGPFVPASLLRPGVLPVVPFPSGLRFQAVHARDVAEAFRLALHDGGARGAYNVAADPVVDGAAVARLLDARLVTVPPWLARAALAAAWHARLAPAEPALFDLAMALPTMRTDRARRELGWSPGTSATEALAEALAGMAQGSGADTAPLAPVPPRRRLGGGRAGRP
jgi:UDP-glucose 4-epimerase